MSRQSLWSLYEFLQVYHQLLQLSWSLSSVLVRRQSLVQQTDIAAYLLSYLAQCSANGQSKTCHSERTKHAAARDVDDDDNLEVIDNEADCL